MEKFKVYASVEGCYDKKENRIKVFRNIEDNKKLCELGYKNSFKNEDIDWGNQLADSTYIINVIKKLEGKFLTILDGAFDDGRRLNALKDQTKDDVRNIAGDIINQIGDFTKIKN